MRPAGSYIVRFEAVPPMDGGTTFEEFLGALFNAEGLPEVLEVYHVRRDESASVVVEMDDGDGYL